MMFVSRCPRALFHTLIHFNQYPLHDRQSNVYQRLIENNREEFHRTGCLYLPKFLTNETLQNILEEIQSIPSNELFQSFVQHTDNLYEINSNENQSSSKTIIAFDQIPLDSLLRKLYSWSNLIDYIRDVIDIYPKLYPSIDRLGACYVNIYRQSNQLSWHTDHSHFFVNLLLQQASNCHEGIFQYKTIDRLKIIHRDDFQSAGFVLFNGRRYLHRVSPVISSIQPRINAILTYDCNPDHQLSEYVLRKFFGRIQ